MCFELKNSVQIEKLCVFCYNSKILGKQIQLQVCLYLEQFSFA